METEPNLRAQERIAWFLLAVLGVFIIVLIAYLANYQPFVPAYMLSPTQVIQVSSPTEPPVPTLTSTPTQRATWTLRPLDTPTVTQTPTITPESTRVMLPTLTAALPYKFNFRYELASPEPETAQRITMLMRQLPDALYDTSEERQSAAYHQAYKYAEFAYQEALLRYPDAPQSGEWRWGLAFSQAQTGNPNASLSYAELLQQEYYEEKTPLEELPEWFHSNEPALTLALHPMGENSDYTLLEIQPGEMYLLMQLNSSKKQIFPLFETFVFEPEIPAAYYFGDLTGDGANPFTSRRKPATGCKDEFCYKLVLPRMHIWTGCHRRDPNIRIKDHDLPSLPDLCNTKLPVGWKPVYHPEIGLRLAACGG
jgi:hypothetical protein